MTRSVPPKEPSLDVQEGATALLAATLSFLISSRISKKLIVDFVRNPSNAPRVPLRRYMKVVRQYEDMGLVMATWFSRPTFLDSDGHPLPLTETRGDRSVRALVRLSRVRISATTAVGLLRRSTSVRIDNSGNFVAVKRMFVLPDFEVPRAALVIGRYLDTLRRNSSSHRTGTTLLLERNCHVNQIEPRRISPILRDIKGRGTSFMDSVDGDIEAHRVRTLRSKKGVGELGVLVFAWTRSSKRRRSKLDANAFKR